jgi:kinesin family protein 1/kinesin family protein 3/17
MSAPDAEAAGSEAAAEAAAEVPESIIVGVRVKPSPGDAAVHVAVDVETGRVRVSPGVNERAFYFDYTYAAGSTQQQIYEDLGAPILRKALQGFNGTIFAYGQTGSGKTHTMQGDGTDDGIVPRLGEELFFVVDQALSEDPDRKFLLTASYLEIHNECLHDLLRPAPRRAGSGGRRDAGSTASGSDLLEIKEHPSLGVHVKGLVEMPVRDRQQLARLMSDGNARRATGETLMNARSSRSHAIFSLRVTQQEAVAGTDGKERRERWSKINLVDLAGSERASKSGAEGGRLKEGIAINVSLSALGNVIIALASAAKSRKRPHIPYRNSKLTRVLQESLGGNSLTVMVRGCLWWGEELQAACRGVERGKEEGRRSSPVYNVQEHGRGQVWIPHIW